MRRYWTQTTRCCKIKKEKTKWIFSSHTIPLFNLKIFSPVKCAWILQRLTSQLSYLCLVPLLLLILTLAFYLPRRVVFSFSFVEIVNTSCLKCGFVFVFFTKCLLWFLFSDNNVSTFLTELYFISTFST